MQDIKDSVVGDVIESEIVSCMVLLLADPLDCCLAILQSLCCSSNDGYRECYCVGQLC